jgi:hypothetical protein
MRALASSFGSSGIRELPTPQPVSGSLTSATGPSGCPEIGPVVGPFRPTVTTLQEEPGLSEPGTPHYECGDIDGPTLWALVTGIAHGPTSE